MDNVGAALAGLLGLGLAGLAVVIQRRQAPPPLEEVTPQGERVDPTPPAPPASGGESWGPSWFGEQFAPGTAQELPRGLRNNNPGNIVANPRIQWAGQVGDDGRFVIFSHPVYGIRAMTRVLRSYRARGVDTLREIIETWAPPHENNTAGYIRFVEQRSGLRARQVIEDADFPALIDAIITKENGQQPYNYQQLVAGIAAADSEGSYA